MTQILLNEARITPTVNGILIDEDISYALKQAESMSKSGGSAMVVVRIPSLGVCILSEPQLTAVRDDSMEMIFHTQHGFMNRTVA